MANLVTNKKAGFKYAFLEKFEAGIELLGHEVKAIKSGRGSLEGSYVIVRGGELFLVGAQVPEYQAGNSSAGYDDRRPRKLLMSKAEIEYLDGKLMREGLTIVPLSVYNKGQLVKIEIALAKGNKKSDKREKIKERDSDRERDRTLKNQ